MNFKNFTNFISASEERVKEYSLSHHPSRRRNIVPSYINFSEFFGWYGAIAILVGFFCVSFGYLAPQSFGYLILNLTGALGITTEAYRHRAFPSVFLNSAYTLVAIVAILKLFGVF